MKPSVEILNELMEISPLLAGLEKKNVFSVPEDYFTHLPIAILQLVNSPGSVSFKGLDERVLTVPEGYFENLSSNILNKIKGLKIESASEEIKNLSPVLYSLQNKNVFRVPEGYFNQLSHYVIQTVRPKAKLVSIKQKSSVWKIAVAAMMTGIIAVSSLWVSQKEIETGLVINDKKNIPAVVAPIKYTDDEINDGIAKLSDDDIIKYLHSTSDIADNESLTASVEEKDLPEQQDYLLDEKTLQNYLDKIETTTSN